MHGDYSPKNMLVRGENIFLIDFEVVHWGDPAFDAAFLMNHLFLKAFHQPAVEPAVYRPGLRFLENTDCCPGAGSGRGI